ncbi:hypothetical protein PV05_11082 [Exophiala xenobiotica]|uniref:Uncharacterized protein n=1 Tax=Exophiala xenobiotica TaxID=348802 RepID=A0A0D2CHV7_9EURO|nr:uncharacterized protein PV05_11082 [Exophiala xenobiotica]KIW49402.1 hypothetical protein PV05_11082 [Exophiala xenobiotica]
MKFLLTAAFALSISALKQEVETEGRDIDSILLSLQSDPDGFVHSGDDGVVRSYAANFTVLSFAKLDPEQIWAVVGKYPQDYQEQLGPRWAEVYENVDGRTVSNVSQILHPGDEILPEEVKSTSPNNDDLEERDLDSNLDLAKRQGMPPVYGLRQIHRSQQDLRMTGQMCEMWKDTVSDTAGRLVENFDH